MPYLIPIGLAFILLLGSVFVAFVAWSDLSSLGVDSSQASDAITVMIICATLSVVCLLVIWFTLRLARRRHG
jgi:hypothetical protein